MGGSGIRFADSLSGTSRTFTEGRKRYSGPARDLPMRRRGRRLLCGPCGVCAHAPPAMMPLRIRKQP